MERFLYWYIGNLHILTNTYTTALTTKQVARKVLFTPRLTEHIPLPQISSIVNKGIRGVFILFYGRTSHAQKAQKAQDNKQATFFLLDVFYAYKNAVCFIRLCAFCACKILMCYLCAQDLFVKNTLICYTTFKVSI